MVQHCCDVQNPMLVCRDVDFADSMRELMSMTWCNVEHGAHVVKSANCSEIWESNRALLIKTMRPFLVFHLNKHNVFCRCSWKREGRGLVGGLPSYCQSASTSWPLLEFLGILSHGDAWRLNLKQECFLMGRGLMTART